MIALNWLTMHSNFSMLPMSDVSKFLKFEMISSIKDVSWSLFGGIENFEVWMEILMERGAWSEDRQFLG